MKRRIRRWGVVLCFVGVLGACTTMPETGRSAFVVFPESYLEQMAAAQFTQLKSDAAVLGRGAENERVERIGRRIADVVDPNLNWEFVVFDDPQVVNAFAMPGGKVGVYTGLINLVESDDELAAVMGHEVAHVRLRHGNERMSQQAAATGLAVGVDVATREESEETRQLFQQAFSIGSQLGVLLPFSRLHEREADEVGLMYAARAGYDPRAAVTFWQKMKALGGEQPPQFLSTHPSHEDRISRLNAAMPEAIAVYEEAKLAMGR